MEEERQKKLQAGKEKFAQLLKKKNQCHTSQKNVKKQKKTDISADSSVSMNHSDNRLPLVPSGFLEMESHRTFSESLSVGSIEETRFHPDVSSGIIDTNHQLCSTTFDVNKSQEYTVEYSLALSDMHEASGKPQEHSSKDFHNDSSLREVELRDKVEEYTKKLQEFQNALAHRDVIISQITTSLQTTIKQRDALQAEADLQADSLVLEVNTLKLQLQQASEMLRTHKGKNGISAQELLDVKNQVISLEQTLCQRDDKIMQLQQQRNALSSEFSSVKLHLEQNIDRLTEKLEKAKEECTVWEQQYQNVCKSIEETKLLLSQREHDLQLMKQQIQDVKDMSSKEIQDLMQQLEVLQQSQQNEPSAKQMMAVMQAELDEVHGLQISQIKQQMVQQQEIQLKQLQTQLDSCAQQRDHLQSQIELLRNNNPVPIINTGCRESSGDSTMTDKSELEILISKQKAELDRLNSLVQRHKQDSEKQKCHHASEIRRVQKLHDEELKRKINDVESSKQTITSLKNNVKHLQNELQNVKANETNIDFIKEKVTLELQSEHERIRTTLTSKLEDLLLQNRELETKLLSISSELTSRKEIESKLIAARQEIKLLKEEHETLVQEVNASQKQSATECLDWDIAINLGDVMKEMLEIKTENQKLKAVVDNVDAVSSANRVEASGELPRISHNSVVDTLEGGDNNLNNNVDEAQWEKKCDELLQEKLELEMKLHAADMSEKLLELETLVSENKDLKNRIRQISDLEQKVEKLAKERNELKNRILQLEDDLLNHQNLKTKCETLESEKSQLKEKYLNQINSLEKVKLDLELSVKEMESKYCTAVKLKQDIEEEFRVYKQCNTGRKCPPADHADVSGVENLIKQVMSLENSIAVLRLRLHQEEELKNVLSAKMVHLMERCETYDKQRKDIKNELETLCSQLEVVWKQHEQALQELADARRELTTNKITHEKEVAMLQEELQVQVSELDGLRIKVDEAYILGSDDAKLNRVPDAICVNSGVHHASTQVAGDMELDVKDSSCATKLVGNMTNIDCVPECSEDLTDTLEINQKLELVLDSNKHLLAEKDVLLDQLRSQASLLKSLKDRMSNNELLSSEVQENFEKQLGALQIQQNSFLHQLCDHKEKQLKLMDVLEDRSLLQETWRRETEDLKAKFKEKDGLETQLLQQKVQLERCRSEKRSLEEQLLSKDRLEQEMMRQRRILEEELIELEQRLRDREDVLLREKAQLQSELLKKDLTIRKWRSDFNEKQFEFEHINSSLLVKQNDQVKRIHMQLQQDGMSQIEQLRHEMDKHHAMAIARLKRDLQEQFAVRESRFVEWHSAEVLNLNAEHKRQLELLRSELEGKDSSLKTDSSSSASDSEVLNIVGQIKDEFQNEWEKLRTQLDSSQQSAFENLYVKIETCKSHEMKLLKKQLKRETTLQLQEQKQYFLQLQKEEENRLTAVAQHAKSKALAELQENLTKSHKDELNKTVQLYETTINNLHMMHSEQLTNVLEIKTLSMQDVLRGVVSIALHEYKSSVTHLTQQWESEYLERLASLRKELEEKFQAAVSATREEAGRTEAPQDERPARMKETSQFEEVHHLLQQKEELIKKATEMRQTLEGVTISETNILKEHMQHEFNTVLEIQKDIKRDIETSKIPVLIELQKVKEDYQQLQEKYEEIIQEHIEITEYPIKKAVSKPPASGGDLQQVGKTTEEVEDVKHLEVVTQMSPEGKPVTLEEELKSLKEKLEKKHLEEMEQLRIYFEQRCESMERKYVEEVSRQRTCHSDDGDEDNKGYTLRDHGARPPTLTHFCDAYAMEPSFRDFEEHYKKEFDDKLQQYREQLEEVRRDIELKHAAEIKTLQMQKDSNIKLEIENVRMELTEKYTQEIEELLSRHEEEVENLRSKCAEDLAREVTKVRVECTSGLAEEIESECKKVEERLKAKYLKDLDNLRAKLTLQHQSELEIVETRLNAQKSEDINQAILSLRDNLQQEREKAKLELAISNQESLLDKMAEDTSSSAIHKAQMLEDLRQQVESEVESEHQAVILELKLQLNTVTDELKNLQAASEEEEKRYIGDVETLKENLLATQDELHSLRKMQSLLQTSSVAVQVELKEEDKDNLLAESQKESRIALEVLREQFQDEIKELAEESEKKTKSVEEKWQQHVKEALSLQENEISTRHFRALEQLREQHKLELAEERSRLQDELTTDHITKFEAVTHELDSNHQMELEELKLGLLKENEEAMEQLRHDMNMKEKEFKSLIQEMKENHEKDMEELQLAHSRQLASEVRRIRQEMESLNDEKLQAVALDTDVLKNELESIHRGEIIEFQEKISKKHQEEMECEIKKTIEEMENNFQATIAKLDDRHSKELQHLREDLEENFDVQLENARQELMQNKEAEIAELQLRFAEELNHLQQRGEAPRLGLYSSISETELYHPKTDDAADKEPLKCEENVIQENKQSETLAGEDVHLEKSADKLETEGELIASLKEHIKLLTSERETFHNHNEHLQQVLSDLLKSYMTAETTINQQLAVIAGEDGAELSTPRKPEKDIEESTLESGPLEINTITFLSEEGVDLDLSHRISENMFAGSNLDPSAEDIIYTTGVNLQLAVKRLLHLLAVTVHQCHESKLAQLELVDDAAENAQKAATLIARCEELQVQLNEEIKAKDQLALELHKASGLISSFEKEKNNLEAHLNKQEETQHSVLAQLEQQQARNHELEERMAAEKDHLQHQRTIIAEGLGEHEQLSHAVTGVTTVHSLLTDDPGLLEENSRLYANHRDLQRQSEKDKQHLTARIHELELALEEHVLRSEELLEERRREIEDLRQQVEALEKQLRANKQFIEEQTADREQEREDFQRQLLHVENIMKEKERLQGTEGRLSHETVCAVLPSSPTFGSTVETLAEQLQEKTLVHRETELKKAALEAELQALIDKISDLKEIVSNLETQLENKARTEQELAEQVKNLKDALAHTTEAHDELASELEVLRHASSSADLTNHIKFLEDQLESRSHELESLHVSQNLMHELRGQIQNIESKVEKKTRDLEALQLSVSSVSSPSSEELSLRDQLEAMRSMNSDYQDTSESLMYFDDIRRLEEKIDALGRAEEAAIKKTRDLEMSLRKQKHIEEELLQDKDALQHQVNKQLLQISALQARIEERRHNLDGIEAAGTIANLQEVIERERELLENKEKECEDLRDQLEQTRQQLVIREDEVAQLMTTSKLVDRRQLVQPPVDSKIVTQLKEENKKLLAEVETLQEHLSSASMTALTETLLHDKNEEIDHLTAHLEELQLQLAVHQSKPNKIEPEVKNIPDKPLVSARQEKRNLAEDLASLSKDLQGNNQGLDAVRVLAIEKDAAIEQLELDLKKMQELAEQRKREVESLRGVLKEKQALLIQLETLQSEVESLTSFQNKLENEVSELKIAVVAKDKDVHTLQDRLDCMAQNGAIKQDELRREIMRLRDQLESGQNDSIEVARRDSESSSLSTPANIASTETDSLLQESFRTGNESKLSPCVETSHETLAMRKLQDKLDMAIKQIRETSDQLAQREQEFHELQHINEGLNNAILMATRQEAQRKHELEIAQKLGNQSQALTKELEIQLQKLQENNRQLAVQCKDLKSNSSEIEASYQREIAELQLKLHSMLPATIPNENKQEIQKQLQITEQHLHILQSELQEAHDKHLTQSKMAECLIYQLKNDLSASKEEENKAKASLAMAKESQQTLEVKFVLGQSEIDKLCDELLQQQEEISNLQHSLLTEKENVRKLEKDHEQDRQAANEEFKSKLEAQANKHKAELEQAALEQKSYSSDSGSATDVAQSITVEVERTKQLDSNMVRYLNGHLLGKTESPDQSGTESEPDTTRSQPVTSELQALLNKVHKEGVEVLSLSELLLLRSRSPQNEDKSTTTLDTLHQAWESEKRQLLVEIMALKELLTQTTEASASLRSTGQVTTELNSVLLKAVGTVFKQERSTLIAELRTQILSSASATPSEVQRLEHRIEEMDAHQRTVFSQLQQSLESMKPAEHASISDENMQKERLKHCRERERLIKHIAKLEDQLLKREKHLKQQLEMLEYRAQQEKTIAEDLRTSLDMEKKRTCELTGQLTEVRGNVSDLEMAVATARTDLMRLQSSADRDKQEIQNLKFNLDYVLAACESEKLRGQVLMQALESEQGNFSQLQEALEAEKRCGKAKSDRQQRVVQELQRSLELSKEKQVEATAALEKERLALVAAKADLSRLQQESDGMRRTGSFSNADVLNVCADMNRKIDLKSALEKERQRSATLTNTLLEERTKAAEELDSERSTCRQFKRKLDALTEESSALRRDLQHEKERAARLDSERSHLQVQVASTKEAEKQRLAEWEAERQLDHEQHRETDLQLEQNRQNKKDLEMELQARAQKIKFLEKEIKHLHERERQLVEELDVARETVATPSSPLLSSYMKQPTELKLHDCHAVEAGKQQLQCLILQFVQDLENIELKYRENMYSSIPEIKSTVESLKNDINKTRVNMMSNINVDDPLSVTQFVEQVLHQNAELVGFVSRLCEEKLELRRIQSELEEDLITLRQKEVSADQASRRSNGSLAAERSSWAQERATLQLSLHKVEAELTRLRSELRSRALTNEHEPLPTGSSSARIEEKLHRLHLKYLRAESFRKALIYQKKYLLILLGGFQDTEAATLAAIARMGVTVPLPLEPQPRQMFIRFRSAVRVVIAIHRLKFLVRRWRHPMRPAFSPFGSHHDVRNLSNSGSNGCLDENVLTPHNSRPPSAPPDTRYRGIHRVGTTPPVRDLHSNNSSRATSERSGSTARRSLLRLPVTTMTDPIDRSTFPPENFDRTLRQYKERLESLQQQLVITSISTVTDTHRNVESFS